MADVLLADPAVLVAGEATPVHLIAAPTTVAVTSVRAKSSRCSQ